MHTKTLQNREEMETLIKEHCTESDKKHLLMIIPSELYTQTQIREAATKALENNKDSEAHITYTKVMPPDLTTENAGTFDFQDQAIRTTPKTHHNKKLTALVHTGQFILGTYQGEGQERMYEQDGDTIRTLLLPIYTNQQIHNPPRTYVGEERPKDTKSNNLIAFISEKHNSDEQIVKLRNILQTSGIPLVESQRTLRFIRKVLLVIDDEKTASKTQHLLQQMGIPVAPQATFRETKNSYNITTTDKDPTKLAISLKDALDEVEFVTPNSTSNNQMSTIRIRTKEKGTLIKNLIAINPSLKGSILTLRDCETNEITNLGGDRQTSIINYKSTNTILYAIPTGTPSKLIQKTLTNINDSQKIATAQVVTTKNHKNTTLILTFEKEPSARMKTQPQVIPHISQKAIPMPRLPKQLRKKGMIITNIPLQDTKQPQKQKNQLESLEHLAINWINNISLSSKQQTKTLKEAIGRAKGSGSDHHASGGNSASSSSCTINRNNNSRSNSSSKNSLNTSSSSSSNTTTTTNNNNNTSDRDRNNNNINIKGKNNKRHNDRNMEESMDSEDDDNEQMHDGFIPASHQNKKRQKKAQKPRATSLELEASD
jgi:hypothetical protein